MNEDLLFSVARLDEYAGPWLLEPSVQQKIDSGDWKPLIASKTEPVAAMVKMPVGAGKSIAIIQAVGVMLKQMSWLGGTSTIQLRQELRAAAADEEVGAILLMIDSPGGSTAGMADLAADAKAAGKQKPLWAQISDVGASAAYWLASQASRVIASSDLTMVGSIGVYQPLYDMSAAAEREGVKVHLSTTGPLKGMGVPGTPITEAHKAYVDSLVAYIHEKFSASVQRARGLSNKELAAVTHGGVMPAPLALEARLIDAIQSFEKTKTELTAAMKAGGRRSESDSQPTSDLAACLRTNHDAGRSGALLPMALRRLPMLRA